MSKVPVSKSPSRSRSGSGSRSPSRSFSRSRTRTRSRSRSRKHRYSSRSRSRSRSHSPPHNRERNYPREYQNNREFRGYNRGFRRPYYYRGRGRGYYPRGRYQRGGGYGNYRPNWQNYRQQPQQHHQHSPRRGRSRSRSPKRRSGTPRSRSRSRYSDRSSSGRSRRTRGSSSSDSRSSSTHSRSGSSKRNAAKELKESGRPDSAAKEAQRAGSRDEEAAGAAGGEGAPDRASGSWQGLIDYDTSPKRTSPAVRSAIIVSQGTAHPSPSLQSVAVKRPSPAVKGGSPSPSRSSAAAQSKSLGNAPWQSSGPAPTSKSPPQQSPTAVFSGFGFFSKDDVRAGEKPSSVSTAFKKFLEEHKNKIQVAEWENGREKEQKMAELERDKGNGKAGSFDKGAAYSGLKPDYYSKNEEEKYGYDDEFELGSAAEFLKGPQFGSAEAGEDQEKRHKVRNQKEREMEDEPKHKSKITITANRDMFDERFNKWDELAYFPSAKEKLRKEEDAGEDDIDDVEEELYRSRKQERAAAAAAAAKKAEASGYRGFSPDKAPKASRKKEKQGQSPSPPARKSSENREREMFNVRRDDSPPRSTPAYSGKRSAEVSVRMDPFHEDYASSSGVLANERRFSRDLVHPSKKDQEFRSIFQHIQSTQLRRSPSELFAQHIVTIVHHIKAQHFESSGMTLNERFAMYQRRAAEMMKPRKSPEIHRRIDVSPSAFRKHSHLFEEMKSSRESSSKDEGKKMKTDSMDLRLDIERRKKYSSKEREHKRDGMRDSGESRGSSLSRERSTEKSSKHHKKTKKRKKTRERSRSSSESSSSSHSFKGGDYPEGPEQKEEGFNKARLGVRDYGGPMERGRGRGGFFRIRGRGWNRGNYPGNNSNGNPSNPGNPVRSKEEEWDPEYTPKSKKYYLHDDREGEGEKKWVDNRGRGRGTFQRGRGRFMFRKTSSSPKWTHDKFQGSGEEGELPDDSDAENKEEDKSGGTAATEQ
ncbi:thyroid hormone receptor-associated protein 3 isoform X2 [Lepisosteus oculatus]|uniref:thyroid hormone receptor-associated protein 3 isoform X2 n=1 Tax=Lepisosteus oculatus TaxID=7918 RepID=UPI00073FD099|nr:PREDICTED: thyroid hormone receptor-associated protein 3 isoform X2 [Lepisosteus oculatus]